MDIVIVYEPNTKKLIPFSFGSSGEVILHKSNGYTEDDLIVSSVDIERVDLFTGYLLDGNGAHEKN